MLDSSSRSALLTWCRRVLSMDCHTRMLTHIYITSSTFVQPQSSRTYHKILLVSDCFHSFFWGRHNKGGKSWIHGRNAPLHSSSNSFLQVRLTPLEVKFLVFRRHDWRQLLKLGRGSKSVFWTFHIMEWMTSQSYNASTLDYYHIKSPSRGCYWRSLPRPHNQGWSEDSFQSGLER